MKMQRHLPPTAAPLAFQDLVTGALGLVCAGSFQRTLESEIKTFFDVKHVFLLTSGKAALTTILRGLKADSSRRQVIIPAYTCFSVPSAVLKAGLEVVLCDVDPHTLDLNLQRLRETVGPNTLAVVVPHLLGQPADIPAIRGIAEPVGALIIEDAAQAMGCKSDGRWLGTQGDIGFFSVGRGKNLSAGSGGVIVTNSARLAESVRREYASLAAEPIMAIIGNLLKVVVATFLIHPKLYWIPAGIPFLGLGETKFYSDFPVCRMDGIRVGLLSSWRGRLDESNRCRVQTRRSFLDR
ncbi:MAG: DegT/DnrJ/EryC1/StrS aminotransferase family protein, partial [Nitrospira sp.]|nr:DegT/DnrJ/EryC1/StrS aminotransferase family protein [Nitrospira sp.]